MASFWISLYETRWFNGYVNRKHGEVKKSTLSIVLVILLSTHLNELGVKRVNGMCLAPSQSVSIGLIHSYFILHVFFQDRFIASAWSRIHMRTNAYHFCEKVYVYYRTGSGGFIV